MSVIFETPRFRVHISGQVAWLENMESGQWVLRRQLAIPISVEALRADPQPSLLREAVLEFEQTRAGNTNLRAALTGYRGAETVQILPREVAQTARKGAPPARRLSIWTPQPLRPPLAKPRERRPVTLGNSPLQSKDRPRLAKTVFPSGQHPTPF